MKQEKYEAVKEKEKLSEEMEKLLRQEDERAALLDQELEKRAEVLRKSEAEAEKRKQDVDIKAKTEEFGKSRLNSSRRLCFGSSGEETRNRTKRKRKVVKAEARNPTTRKPSERNKRHEEESRIRIPKTLKKPVWDGGRTDGAENRNRKADGDKTQKLKPAGAAKRQGGAITGNSGSAVAESFK